MTSSPICVVSWPTAPLTKSLVLKSLEALHTSFVITSTPHTIVDPFLIQWSTYDQIDHELTHLHRQKVLSSSYTFRKALIRKHFLSQCILSYITKHPTSLLKAGVPQTFDIEISFVDELEEMWTDDLWELGEKLDNTQSWWILKPGMADRGMGIRLFNSKETLQQIFEEFENTDNDHSDADNGDTSVIISQLRHFVIQEYISNPLLLSPPSVGKNSGVFQESLTPLQGYKFHLRAYCVCQGALQVYLYDRILALFSAVPYVEPTANIAGGGLPIDLAPHLTNTSLQPRGNEESVRLLQELVGCQILSYGENVLKFKQEDVTGIVSQMVCILAETFRAALENPIHFQPIPNAFELYGIDFLIAHEPSRSTPSYSVKLLEINAEPAIEFTGPRLTWILEDLFISIGKICVEPFVAAGQVEAWEVGDTRLHMIKCLQEEIRAK